MCHSITTDSRKRLQKQLFCNIYELFSYVLYNIKYLFVMSHSGSYPFSLIVTYSMISAYYALTLGNRPFPNLLFHQILFCSHLRKCRKYINNLVIHPQEWAFAKFKANFPVILRIFDFESHSQTSVKVELVMFGLVLMKLRKLIT